MLPITPQRYLSKAKYCLKAAHQELMKTGFLKKVIWRKSKTDPKKWILIYHFGVRAKSEHQRGFKDDTYRPAILAVETADLEEIEDLIEPEKKETPAVKPKQKHKAETLSPIARELINRGITKAVAIDFAESFPDEHIREKIELHDYKKEIGEITTNAAGWLREAIVQDYKLSEAQLKQRTQLEQKQAQQEEQGILEDKAREIQEQRLKEALQTFPEAEQWVRERVVQKRGWLISHYKEYALSSIISALKEEQQQSLVEESGALSHFKESTQTADEPVLLNSIEYVLVEVARQMDEFEGEAEEK